MLISEEFLLLALDDDSGKISYSGASSFPFGMVSGFLLDLLFRGRIVLKDRRVKLIDMSSTSDPLLDDILKRMGELSRELRLRSWIIQLSVAFRNVYSKGILSRLTDQGVLVREEKPRLKIFHSIRHPLVQPAIKDQVLQRIEGIILDKQDADAHFIALLSLVQECGLIGSLFIRQYRGIAETRIQELLTSDKISNQEREIINSTVRELTGLLLHPPFKAARKIRPKIFKKKSDVVFTKKVTKPV